MRLPCWKRQSVFFASSFTENGQKTLYSVYSTVHMSDCSVVLCVRSRRRFIWCVSRSCDGSGNDFHRRLVQCLKLSNFLVTTVASRCSCQSRVWHYLTPTQHSELRDSTDVLKCLYPIRLVMKDTHPITPPLPSLSLAPYPAVTASDLVWMQPYSKWAPFLLCLVWC